MPTKKTSVSDPLLSIDVVSELVNKACRTIRENCVDGKYSFSQKDETGSWLIPLSSLPPIAQARYWIKCARDSKNIGNIDNLRELTEEEEENLWLFFDEWIPVRYVHLLEDMLDHYSQQLQRKKHFKLYLPI